MMKKEKYKPIRSNPNRKPGNYKLQTMSKAEKALIDEKVYQVAVMLAKGISQRQIRREKSLEWECTEQNVYYYIKKALLAMQCSVDKKMDVLLGLQRERLEFILRGAIEKKDYATAQKIIDTMNKVYGLYEERKNIKIDAPTIKFDFGNINNADKEEEVDSE